MSSAVQRDTHIHALTLTHPMRIFGEGHNRSCARTTHTHTRTHARTHAHTQRTHTHTHNTLSLPFGCASSHFCGRRETQQSNFSVSAQSLTKPSGTKNLCLSQGSSPRLWHTQEKAHGMCTDDASLPFVVCKCATPWYVKICIE